jgi:predicted transcriptional regulator
MTLRLDPELDAALAERARREGRSKQEVAREAIRVYVEHYSKRELLDLVLDTELPRYADALARLGQ